MDRFRHPVIVVGAGPNALGLVRSFGRRGIDVFLVSDKRNPAGFSKYCRKSFMISGVSHDRAVLENALREVGKRCSRKPVVYPTSDMAALNLAELKGVLADDYYFVVGDSGAVRTLVDKKRFYKVLSEHRIAYPRTYFPTDAKEIRILGTQLDYPIFVKPSITQLFSRAFPRAGKGFVAHTLRELSYYYRLAAHHGIEVMFQETIPGPAANSYQLEGYYNARHSPLVVFTRQRQRIWPPDFGNTTLCVSIPLAKLAAERSMIDRFLATIGYNGLMSAEFKRDDRDGVLKLLEINARPWWHLWLSEKCGVDIALISYLDAIGNAEVQSQNEQYEVGVKSLHLINDIRAAAHMFSTKELSSHEWVSSLKGKKCFAFFSRNDPLPFIVLPCFR
jgi:predicted ATP-grasp superfamily ATP-dependent carboligase